MTSMTAALTVVERGGIDARFFSTTSMGAPTPSMTLFIDTGGSSDDVYGDANRRPCSLPHRRSIFCIDVIEAGIDVDGGTVTDHWVGRAPLSCQIRDTASMSCVTSKIDGMLPTLVRSVRLP